LFGRINGDTNRAAAPVNRRRSASAFRLANSCAIIGVGFASGVICSALVSMVKANAQV
jgi:hypothetical protein